MFTHVRPLHPQLQQVLQHSYERSLTVRGLVDELERSNVIVHIVPRIGAHGPPGALRFVTSSDTVRILRITLDERLTPDALLAAFLGHELQHAVEVARARWVTDLPAFEALYREIADTRLETAGGTEYDTAAARRAGAAVLAEFGSDRRGRAAAK